MKLVSFFRMTAASRNAVRVVHINSIAKQLVNYEYSQLVVGECNARALVEEVQPLRTTERGRDSVHGRRSGATFVQPRYHQDPRWVQLRESLGPEDDAFRSGVHREHDRFSDHPVAFAAACLHR